MKRILIIWALLISVCFAQSKPGFYVVGGKVITVQDTSSRKYLKAVEDAGVVPSVVQNFASNYLVTSEKSIGTWTLIKAQYPFIGGTAATHKFNLNDPRDLDAAYRLTYTGTVLHDSNGINSQTGGYANTYLIPSTAITSINNTSTAIYITNAPTPANFVDIGVIGSNANTQRFALRGAYDNTSNRTASSSIGQINVDANSSVSVTGKAVIIGSRSSATVHKIFINGNLQGINNTLNTGTLPTLPMYLLALNGSTPTLLPSKRSLGFVGVMDGSLTDTEAIKQSHIVTFTQSLQGRQ